MSAGSNVDLNTVEYAVYGDTSLNWGPWLLGRAKGAATAVAQGAITAATAVATTAFTAAADATRALKQINNPAWQEYNQRPMFANDAAIPNVSESSPLVVEERPDHVQLHANLEEYAEGRAAQQKKQASRTPTPPATAPIAASEEPVAAVIPPLSVEGIIKKNRQEGRYNALPGLIENLIAVVESAQRTKDLGGISAQVEEYQQWIDEAPEDWSGKDILKENLTILRARLKEKTASFPSPEPKHAKEIVLPEHAPKTFEETVQVIAARDLFSRVSGSGQPPSKEDLATLERLAQNPHAGFTTEQVADLTARVTLI